jgi:hypothetical protein
MTPPLADRPEDPSATLRLTSTKEQTGFALGKANSLIGVGIGSTAHTISHVVGRDLGGTPERDIPLIARMSLLLLAEGLWRWRQ